MAFFHRYPIYFPDFYFVCLCLVGCFLVFLFYDSSYHPVSNRFIHCFLGFLVPLAFCFPFCNSTRGYTILFFPFSANFLFSVVVVCLRVCIFCFILKIFLSILALYDGILLLYMQVLKQTEFVSFLVKNCTYFLYISIP